MSEDAEAQQDVVVRALASGAATGDAGPLERIDTHMSHLFLGPERVYKLLRQRRHPFADMTSLAARRRACDAALTVNRALAPGLYECVAPVTRDPQGEIRVGGDGEPLDWVVVLHRFPAGALLDEIARAGRLTPEMIAEAVDAVAAFHARQPPCRDAGSAEDWRGIVQGLRRTEAGGAGRMGVAPAGADLFAALDREITRLTPLIEARTAAGWTRRGHGDLHLKNICLFEGRVTPFDALEFDEDLATADVIYDLAFLLMDLRARGLAGLANLAMNRYWDAARQPEPALALLPLCMALRAAVRMAVAAEAGDPAEVARYHALGLDLLRPVPPRLLAIGGLSGTGKSTLARAVAADLPGVCGARILRTDTLRKAAAGVAPTDRLPDDFYSPEARAATYGLLAGRVREALAAGASVIADATFREASARVAIDAVADEADSLRVWLQAPADLRAERVAGRRDDASDMTAAMARTQTEPEGLGPAWRLVAARGPTEDLAREVLSLLGS
jgi:aminoglycoside phosphotransferase family enzyme/predicted kinase